MRLTPVALLGAALVAAAVLGLAPTSAPAAPTPSARPGMGAMPFAGGVTFRVWAPNASAVAVAGDFNAWSATATPLARESGGTWSADVPAAAAGQKYKYVITNGAATLWRNDPRARAVTTSVGESIVVNPAYDWSTLDTASTLFADGFEGAALDPGWTASGTGPYLVARSTTYKAAGTRGLVLHASRTGTYATSRLTHTVNPVGFAALQLSYKVRNVGDETHTQDGVFFSTTGTSWIKLAGFPAVSTAFATVTLNLPASAGPFSLRFQQYDNGKLPGDGVALDDVRVTGRPVAPPFATPAWNEMVVYEMHIGTFNDAPGGTPGTFDTASARLDGLADLGINVIEVLPVAEFAGDYSWGYNPGHPFAVEGAYGGPAAFKRFVKAAHARGIAVVVDVVYNHFGPSDLALWQFDGWSENGKGGIYFFNDWRSATPWGDTRPDLGRGEVRSYLRDNALMWLDEYRCDGLRWDSTVNLRTQNNGGGGEIPEGWGLMQWINDEINRTAGWKISIAEDLQSNEWISKPTGAGGAGFDAQWDARFVHPVRAAVIAPSDAARSMSSVADAIRETYTGDAFQRVIYTESHDEVANGKSRVPEEIYPGNAGSWYSRKRSTLGAAVVATAPGIPMIFQGQEMLEDGWFTDTDPLDWAKATTYGGVRALYRDLFRLRRNFGDRTRGLRGQGVNVHHVNDADKVLAWHRWQHGGPGDDVVIVANFSSRSFSGYNLGFPRGGTWKVRLNSDWNGYSADYGNFPSYDTTANPGGRDGMGYNANVGVGPYSVVILSQEP
ncbi:MAG: alpha amylase C-terminal domain-containing protein [Planctomycetes bacterium]|nr:alpha amylase C-terminal domain-containing protein [Planctomycetota bacterium]